MSDQSFRERFKKSIPTLQRTVKREVILPLDQPKLYKKVRKYFESTGVQFYNEVEADYELLLELISEELSLELIPS